MIDIESFKSYFKAKGTVTDEDGNPVPDFIVSYNNDEYPIYLYDVMNSNVYDLVINDECPFRNKTFVKLFEAELTEYCIAHNTEIQKSVLSPIIKRDYQQIIIDKVNIDLGESIYGPTTFENLLMIENPSLYEYLLNSREESNDNIIMLLRSIIKSLEAYTNSSLAGLECKALGSDEYFRILKEVVSYFKS